MAGTPGACSQVFCHQLAARRHDPGQTRRVLNPLNHHHHLRGHFGSSKTSCRSFYLGRSHGNHRKGTLFSEWCSGVLLVRVSGWRSRTTSLWLVCFRRRRRHWVRHCSQSCWVEPSWHRCWLSSFWGCFLSSSCVRRRMLLVEGIFAQASSVQQLAILQGEGRPVTGLC